MKVQELLRGSLRLLKVFDPDGTPTATEDANALEAFNSLIAAWGAKSITVFASISESFSLVAGTASYTMGSAGTASSVRAEKITDCYIRDSGNTDHPVRIISQSEYNAITGKTLRSRPEQLFYDPSYAVGYIYFYPVPSDVETAYIESLKAFTSVSDKTTDLNFPRIYERALKFNLAVDLAAEFGVEVSPWVAKVADDSYRDLIALNSGNKLHAVKFDTGVPGIAPVRYDINTG